MTMFGSVHDVMKWVFTLCVLLAYDDNLSVQHQLVCSTLCIKVSALCTKCLS